MPTIEIRPLQKSDQRKVFYSGNADLDRFLSRYAGQNQFRHSIGVTWVAVDTEQNTDILAYATISPAQLEPEAIAFYEKYGFIELNTFQGSLADRPEPLPIFLSIKDIPSR